MKKVIIFILALSIGTISLNTYATELRGYAAKCAELIEQTKSPAKNWTTSLEEATMAGECIGVIKAITKYMHKTKLYNSSERRYVRLSCKQNSTLKSAGIIVESKSETIPHIINDLCSAY